MNPPLTVWVGCAGHMGVQMSGLTLTMAYTPQLGLLVHTMAQFWIYRGTFLSGMIALIYVQTTLHKLSHSPHLFSWFCIGVPIILTEASVLAHYFKGFQSIPEGKAWRSFSSQVAEICSRGCSPHSRTEGRENSSRTFRASTVTQFFQQGFNSRGLQCLPKPYHHLGSKN